MAGSSKHSSQCHRIAIWGAGGHGRIVLDIFRHYPETDIICFVDEDPHLIGASVEGIRILPPEDVIGITKELEVDGIVPAIGRNAIRRAKFEAILAAGLEVPQTVHPSAQISENVAAWGRGVQVMAGVIVNTGANIGHNVILNTGCTVEHDCIIEDDCFVGPRCVFGGGAHIETGAFLGIGTLVKPGVRIGAGAMTGMGAVVVKDIPAGVLVFGVPAQPVRAL